MISWRSPQLNTLFINRIARRLAQGSVRIERTFRSLLFRAHIRWNDCVLPGLLCKGTSSATETLGDLMNTVYAILIIWSFSSALVLGYGGWYHYKARGFLSALRSRGIAQQSSSLRHAISA